MLYTQYWVRHSGIHTVHSHSWHDWQRDNCWPQQKNVREQQQFIYTIGTDVVCSSSNSNSRLRTKSTSEECLSFTHSICLWYILQNDDQILWYTIRLRFVWNSIEFATERWYNEIHEFIDSFSVSLLCTISSGWFTGWLTDNNNNNKLSGSTPTTHMLMSVFHVDVCVCVCVSDICLTKTTKPCRTIAPMKANVIYVVKIIYLFFPSIERATWSLHVYVSVCVCERRKTVVKDGHIYKNDDNNVKIIIIIILLYSCLWYSSLWLSCSCDVVERGMHKHKQARAFFLSSRHTPCDIPAAISHCS